MNADQGSRNGLWFTEVSLENGKKRVKRVLVFDKIPRRKMLMIIEEIV